MDLEDLPPNKPNFGLVLAIAGAGLLAFFVIAYTFLRRHHVTPGRYDKTPVSQLLSPVRGVESWPASTS